MLQQLVDIRRMLIKRTDEQKAIHPFLQHRVKGFFHVPTAEHQRIVSPLRHRFKNAALNLHIVLVLKNVIDIVRHNHADRSAAPL